ncbi:MAG: tRNA lysidine(34) synthetase TilS [Tissierellia bacterium]|nr:tRNA lysidine(34) synthetase TilS [Tissierellia bacterium]
MKMRTENKFVDNIFTKKLIDKGDNIIAAISGGADSVFLFYNLINLKEKLDFNFVVCHLNHLHRKESFNDEEFVRNLCKENNIEFFYERKSMDDYAKKLKITPEDAGRRLRYDFFRRISKKYSNSKIAVAHNMDDQVETVIMRMIRGTGIDGLKAMDFSSYDIIRPILNYKKSEITQILDKNNIRYVNDKTNFSTDYTRNKIRLEIIPKFLEINPKAIESIFNLSFIAKSESRILDAYDEELFEKMVLLENNNKIKLDNKLFESIDLDRRYRIIRYTLKKLLGNLDNINKIHIETISNIINLGVGKEIEISDFRVLKNYKSYDFYKKTQKNTDILNLSSNQIINFSDFVIKTSIIEKEEFENINKKHKYFFDSDLLEYPLKLRTRRNGDRIKPFGMDNNKKLKDLFIDMKVDKTLRDNLPIILSSDTIIAVCSIKRSNCYIVTENTKKILVIEYWRKDEYEFQ